MPEHVFLLHNLRLHKTVQEFRLVPDISKEFVWYQNWCLLI